MSGHQKVPLHASRGHGAGVPIAREIRSVGGRRSRLPRLGDPEVVAPEDTAALALTAFEVEQLVVDAYETGLVG